MRDLSNLKARKPLRQSLSFRKARSEADWLVGINASRVPFPLHAGVDIHWDEYRLQPFAMVCRRYIENRDFCSSFLFGNFSALVENEGMSLKRTIGSTRHMRVKHSAQTALAYAPHVRAGLKLNRSSKKGNAYVATTLVRPLLPCKRKPTGATAFQRTNPLNSPEPL